MATRVRYGILVVAFTVVLSACGGNVTESEEYVRLGGERDELASEFVDLMSDVRAVSSDLETAEADLKAAQASLADAESALSVTQQALSDAESASAEISSALVDAEAEKERLNTELAAAALRQAQATFGPVVVAATDCDYGGVISRIEALDALTVRFTLCRPEAAFREIVAFTPFGIQPAEHLAATGGAPLDNPIGTGPWSLTNWARGDSITFDRFDDYWGEPAPYRRLVFRWARQAAERLVELESGNVDQISFVGDGDFDTVRSDGSLRLLPVINPNTMYLGMTSQLNAFGAVPGGDTVFADPQVRRAIALGIDRQRIVDNFYPEGSITASHFTPCSIENACGGEEWYDFDPAAAKALLTEAGFPDGFETRIFYRDVIRGYLPTPGDVAADIQAQLADNLGIATDVVVMESGQFIDESTNGRLDGLYLLGWSADYPHVTNFLDFHFGKSNPQFGNPHPEIYELLEEGSQITDTAPAAPVYEAANNAIREMVPMVPIAHGASASAALATVEGAHFRPFGAPLFHRVNPGKDTFVFMQNAEPLSLYCADETDGESLAACQQVVEPLLGYALDSGVVEPRLARACTANADATEWTCTIREGVKYHDGSYLDANDVVVSWRAGLVSTDPLHTGNRGTFDYYAYLWGRLIPQDAGE